MTLKEALRCLFKTAAPGTENVACADCDMQMHGISQMMPSCPVRDALDGSLVHAKPLSP